VALKTLTNMEGNMDVYLYPSVPLNTSMSGKLVQAVKYLICIREMHGWHLLLAATVLTNFSSFCRVLADYCQDIVLN
jgi:hypothetical protein